MTTRDTEEVEVKLRAAGKLKLMLTEGSKASSTQLGVPLRDPVEAELAAITCNVNSDGSQNMGVWYGTMVSDTEALAVEVDNLLVKVEPGWTEDKVATFWVTYTSD